MDYLKRIKRRQRQLLHGTRRWLINGLGLWSDRPKVLANGPPKSGTNLLRRCLASLPGMRDSGVNFNRPFGLTHVEQSLEQVYRGSFIKTHIHFTPEYHNLIDRLGFLTILILRDPRDLAVSLLHWATYKYERHRLHPYLRSLGDDAERLMAIIRGVSAEELGTERGIESIEAYVGIFLPWADHGSCVIRFEDLIGPIGGGSANLQRKAIEKLATHLDIVLDEAQIERVANRLFYRGSRTFRKGQIGDWRNHFTSEHKSAFKEVAGQLLIDLGYESDLGW